MFSSINRAIAALKRGEVIALYDDSSAVPSLCLLKEARRIEEQDVTFFAVHARGVICAAIQEDHRRRLALPLMTSLSPKGDDSRQFDFTVSVEARTGVSTGISAADRAMTLRTLATTEEPRRDLVTPGHIFPARAQHGGVLVRSAFAEASIDLLTLAGLSPVAAFVQCLDDDGAFLAGEERQKFLQRFSLAEVSLSDLIRYRLAHESLITRVSEASLPTQFAKDLRAVCYQSNVDGAEHLALVHGNPQAVDAAGAPPIVLVRVQAENPFLDLFGMSEGRGLDAVRSCLAEIAAYGPGVFVYIRHPRRDLLQRTVFQTNSAAANEAGTASPGVKALREMGIGAQILSDLGVRRLKIISSARRDLSGLAAFQLEVVGQVPLAGSAGDVAAARTPARRESK